jgi:hypothetical protein
VYTVTFMGSIKPKSYFGHGSLLDDSFVRGVKAWKELREKPHGENIQYDICVHKGKKQAFRSDVNDRIKNEINEEQENIWRLIDEALGEKTIPRNREVLKKPAYKYVK